MQEDTQKDIENLFEDILKEVLRSSGVEGLPEKIGEGQASGGTYAGHKI